MKNAQVLYSIDVKTIVKTKVNLVENSLFRFVLKWTNKYDSCDFVTMINHVRSQLYKTVSERLARSLEGKGSCRGGVGRGSKLARSVETQGVNPGSRWWFRGAHYRNWSPRARARQPFSWLQRGRLVPAWFIDSFGAKVCNHPRDAAPRRVGVRVWATARLARSL